MHPNHQHVCDVAAAFLGLLEELGFTGAAVLLAGDISYQFSASTLPKEALVMLLRTEAERLEQDPRYARHIELPLPFPEVFRQAAVKNGMRETRCQVCDCHLLTRGDEDICPPCREKGDNPNVS